jgi:hypothetical protein
MGLVRILLFPDFLASLSLKIVWVVRLGQVPLPSVADRPRARHRLRRKLVAEAHESGHEVDIAAPTVRQASAAVAPDPRAAAFRSASAW